MVEVPVIHRDQVHVAEDEAVVLCVFQSLCITDVQQLCTIEGVLPQLWRHQDHFYYITNKMLTASNKNEENMDC